MRHTASGLCGGYQLVWRLLFYKCVCLPVSVVVIDNRLPVSVAVIDNSLPICVAVIDNRLPVSVAVIDNSLPICAVVIDHGVMALCGGYLLLVHVVVIDHWGYLFV